jgi:hypothetical protein
VPGLGAHHLTVHEDDANVIPHPGIADRSFRPSRT